MIDYLAMLTSFNGKATKKAIDARRRIMNQEANKDKESYEKIDGKGENAFGIHVNTTFLDTIKQFGGEEAFNIMQKEVGETSKAIMHEDGDFIKMAKKIAAEEMAVRQEEMNAVLEKSDSIEF